MTIGGCFVVVLVLIMAFAGIIAALYYRMDE